MLINNNNIQQENKKLELEKKNKQNSGISKSAFYTGLSAVSVASISIIGKILYDKLNKNDNNNPEQLKNNDNIGKILYDKLNKNDNNNPEQLKNNDNVVNWQGLIRDGDIQVGNVALTPADQKYFRTFMILLMQQYPLCWHNASMQFLACPEIMFGEEAYEQEFHEKYPPKIRSMIDWMRKQIETQQKDKNLKIEDYFTEKIRKFVPASVREVPDGFEHFIPPKNDTNTGPLKLEACHFMFRSCPGLTGQIYGGEFNGVNFSERMANIGGNNMSDIEFDMEALTQGKGMHKVSLRTIDFIMQKEGYIKNKNKSFTLSFSTLFMQNQPNRGLDMNNIGRIDNLIFRPCGYGFKPTFLAAGFQGHYSVFYFLYNDTEELRYIIRADGGKPGLQVLTIDEFCDNLRTETYNFTYGGFIVRYSPLNIIRKYYTPDLMFNANK